jgi:hypothetical protein
MLKVRHLTDELERLRRYIDGMEDETGPHGEKDENREDER